MTDLAELGFSVNSKEIQGAIRALDNLDKAGDRVEKRGPKVGKGYKKSMMEASKATSSFRGVLGELKGAIGILGFGAIVKSTLDYGSAIKEVSTLVDTATFDMAALSDEAIKQAKQYGVMPTDNVKAFYQAISAGAATAGEATAAVDAANRLAIAGVTDVTTSIDGLTSVMNAYAGEAGSFTDISDAMFVAVRAGKTTVGELASNIGKVAPIAAQAGASLEEVLAATAALTKGGISTTESMTGLRAIMAAVVKPTKDATELAGELGLNFNAAGLESKGFAGFLQEVQDKTGGSTEKLAQLFGGVEALVPIMGLLADDSSEFASILGQMEMKTGSTAAAFDKMTNSSAFQLKRIIASVTAGILEFTTAIDQKAAPGIKVFADGIDSFIAKFKTITTSIADSAIFNSFTDMLSAIGRLLAPVIPYMDDLAIALVGIGGTAAAISLVGTALGAVAAIVLSPVVAGVAALSAGAVVLMNNWEVVEAAWHRIANWWQNTSWTEKARDLGGYIVDGFVAGIKGIGAAIGEQFRGVIAYVKKIFGIQSPSKEFEKIGGYLMQGMANGVKAGVQLVLNSLSGIAKSIIDAAMNPIDTMKKVGGMVIGAYSQGIQIALNNVDQLLGTKFLDHFFDLKGAVTAAHKFVRDLIAEMVAKIKTGARQIVDAMRNVGADVIDGLKQGVRDKIDSLKATILDAADILPDWMKRRLDIQSPSRVMMQIGEDTIEGLNVGMKSKYGDVIDAVSGFSDDMRETLKNFGNGFIDTLADSFRNMDSLKEALRGVEDYTKKWLSDMTATFVETNLGKLFNKGIDMVGGLLTKTKAAESLDAFGGKGPDVSGGLFGGLNNMGVSGYAAAAAAGVQLLSAAVDEFQDFSKKGKKAAVALNVALPGIGTAITALGGQKLFGGKRQQTGSGFNVGFTGGEVTGQSFDTFERRKSLFRGTERTEGNFRALEASIQKDIEQFFNTMLTSVSDGAEMLGISGADEIFDSFEVATKKFKGKNAEKLLQQWLEDSTRDAYELAFDKLGPELQMLIGNSVDMINAPIEVLEGVFSEVGMIASVIAPQMKAVGITLSEAFGSAAVQASDLIDRMGGVESATRSLAIYQSEFAGVQATNEAVLRMNRERLEEWNKSIGLSGGSIIDTRAEMVSFITTLDQTTTAGREATAAAFEQLEAIIAVEDAARNQAKTFNTVSEAARLLNLNFDATSPIAMSAADSLVQLMGGLDQFRSATDRYYNDFFSLEERQQMSLRDSTATVIAFNDALGLSGASAIASAMEFRNYVSSLDLTTEAGQRAYAQALAVSDSMKTFTDAGGDLQAVIHQLPGEMQNSLWSMLNTANESATGISSASQTVLSSLGDAGLELWNFGNAANDSGNAIANAAQLINDSIRRIADMPSFNQTLNDPNLRDASVIQSYLENNPNATRAELQNYLRFYRSQVSAEGGMGRVMYDGQLISAHKDEMVLPSHIADWIRDAASSSDNNAELAEQLDRVNQKLDELNQRTEQASESNMQGLGMVAAATESQTKHVSTHNKEQDRILRRLSQAGQAA